MFEQLFTFANPVLFFWLLMMFLPKWRVTIFLANKGVFPFYLALLYTVGIITVIINEGFGFVMEFGSAEGVIQLLSIPDFALLCWIHILCFDQAIGHYIYHDNMQHRYVSLPIQSIILFATLLFGPFGFLCYLILKTVRKQFKKIV
jgi:hypothetical protein